LDVVVNPVVLYGCLGLGAVGVALALPRPRVTPQLIGALIAGLGLGGALLVMGLNAGDQVPGAYFYVFALIALGSALRVISHPKPVYSALFFILTILSSSALYLMLGAEFMAFALIIIYAGAILITYLFVIMLAEQAPSEEDLGAMTAYDKYSRDPIAATIVGFVMLGVLTAMLSRGVNELSPAPSRGQGAQLIERMPKMVLESLQRQGLFGSRGGLAKPEVAAVPGLMEAEQRTITLTVADADAFRQAAATERVAALLGGPEKATELAARLSTGDQVTLSLPAEVRSENIHGVGFALIAEHPMALELAGVILLMAMLGAVVLARKQIEMGEAEKAAAAVQMGAASGAAGGSSGGGRS
jgi:NADH-quinone oxidoreductase subunit J